MTERPRDSRRWLQISLRGFFVGLSLLAIALGWYARRVERQRQAVRAAVELGGSVWYDDEVDASLFTTGKPPTGARARLGAWLGRDWFQTATVVDIRGLGGRSLTDDDLRALRPLSGLKKLTLCNATEITPAGVRELERLGSLEWLYLHHPAIAAEDLRPLSRLPNLRHLAVTTPLGDAGLRELSQFPALAELELSSEGVTDDGVRHLKNLRSLRLLELSGQFRIPSKLGGELRQANPNLGIDDGSFRDLKYQFGP